MARNYLCVPLEYFLHDAAELTDAEFGRLVRGMYRYFTTGEVISPEGNERFFIKGAMAAQDNFRKKYEEVSKKRREAGKKGANNRWQMLSNDSKCQQVIASDGDIVLDIDIDNSIRDRKVNREVDSNSNVVPREERKEKEKKERKRFVPPTVSEVRAYTREKGYNVDPEKFVAYYESKGWLVGKSPMKNWKAAVVTWSKNNYQRPSQTTSSNGFLDILRDMEAEQSEVIVSEQDGDSTGPFGFASGLP